MILINAHEIKILHKRCLRLKYIVINVRRVYVYNFVTNIAVTVEKKKICCVYSFTKMFRILNLCSMVHVAKQTWKN
jgi:hypothetical protein